MNNTDWEWLFPEPSDLGWIFPEKLETDKREALFVFKLPFLDDKDDYEGADWGFYAPSGAFWMQLLALVGMQALLVACLSTVMYKYILQETRIVTRYLVGYGLIIPLCILAPYYQIVILDIRNKILKFVLASITPTLTIFRCLEAMYDSQPKRATYSMGSYALYCGSPMELAFDMKTWSHIKSTGKDIMKHLRDFVALLLITGLLKSWLLPNRLEPFGSSDEEWYHWERLASANQFRTNMVHAMLFQLYLTLYGQGLALATSLFIGFEPVIFMHNPVLESNSPSEFWGKRWNTLVHGVLKRGVFKPIRRFFSREMAVLFVFMVSGALHEWILSTVFVKHYHELGRKGSCNPPNCFEPPLGGQMGFFLWNAGLVALESLIGGWVLFRRIKRELPAPLVSMLVVSLGLPVVHWFCDPYIRSDFFIDGSIGLPIIKRMSY